MTAIKHAIEQAGLGFNPQTEGKQMRIMVPPLSAERRQQLSTKVKKLGEEQKIAVRNVRRDANKHADGLNKQPGAHFPEDEIETLKEEIQTLLKKFEDEVDKLVADKTKDITTL
jgi:ribosome recycling factor